MKHTFFKTIALILSVVLILGALSSCSNKKADANKEMIDAAVNAALAAAEAPASVTFAADGKYITIEDAEGLSMQQLLAQANITLGKEDLLSVDPTQSVGGNLAVQILRACNVSVSVATKDSFNNVTYRTKVVGGTVSDAIESVGLNPSNLQASNYRLDEPLVDQMHIMITYDLDSPLVFSPSSEIEIQSQPTEETEVTSEEESEEEFQETQNPPAPQLERSVVSIETYEDCDGSGHGVRVITYSDGTQEEVYF